jgi:hypothetical protein
MYPDDILPTTALVGGQNRKIPTQVAASSEAELTCRAIAVLGALTAHFQIASHSSTAVTAKAALTYGSDSTKVATSFTAIKIA